MQVISSKDNEVIKNIKKLKEKKFRDNTNTFIIEGIKLIQEAIEEKVSIKNIIICEECIHDGNIDRNLLYEIAKYECIYVTQKVFNTITDVKSPQGILAIIEKNNKLDNIDYSQEIIFVLDGIQDPRKFGNYIKNFR